MTDKKQLLLWISALVLGAVLGLLQQNWINELADFVAAVYTRLFQVLAAPTIALAIITTLSTLGMQKDTGRIFRHTITYTLLTTVCSALVGLVLFLFVRPDSLPEQIVNSGVVAGVEGVKPESSVYDHILSVIPTNMVQPFLAGNVLSILLLAAAVGVGLSAMKESEAKKTLVNMVNGLQDLMFILIKALIRTLPLGIVAFAAQLTAAPIEGLGGALGKYVLVILGGNLVQFFLILPLFLLVRGLNPLYILKCMSPAVLMAFFTKSSAATLPVTIQSAEQNLNVDPKVSRFVLPICTTINMNGCAAFILVTSLYVMQNGGFISFDQPLLTILPTLLLWLVIAVVSAIGNAGVPMGCYFLTFSLMSGIGAPLSIMGIILPIFTVIDMVETAENVWSDSCVCNMVNKDLMK